MKSSTNNKPVSIPDNSLFHNNETPLLKTVRPGIVALLIVLLAASLYFGLSDNDYGKTSAKGTLPLELSTGLAQGTLLFEKGELEKAATLYRELIEDHPTFPHGYNNLAALYAFRGELDQARILLEQAMATDENFSAIYSNLGKIYGELARDSYVRALQLDAQELKTHLQILDSEGVAQLEANRETSLVVSTTPTEPVGSDKTIPRATSQQTKAELVTTAIPEIVTETATPVETAPPAVEPVPSLETPEDFIQRWASAWSAQDADTYFDFYAEDYVPRSHKTRAGWEKKRRSRIIKPVFIEITLDKIKISKISDDKVEIELIQGYKNDRFQDKTRKQFALTRADNSWLITRERSLGSLR